MFIEIINLSFSIEIVFPVIDEPILSLLLVVWGMSQYEYISSYQGKNSFCKDKMVWWLKTQQLISTGGLWPAYHGLTLMEVVPIDNTQDMYACPWVCYFAVISWVMKHWVK